MRRSAEIWIPRKISQAGTISFQHNSIENMVLKSIEVIWGRSASVGRAFLIQ